MYKLESQGSDYLMETGRPYTQDETQDFPPSPLFSRILYPAEYWLGIVDHVLLKMRPRSVWLMG